MDCYGITLILFLKISSHYFEFAVFYFMNLMQSAPGLDVFLLQIYSNSSSNKVDLYGMKDIYNIGDTQFREIRRRIRIKKTGSQLICQKQIGNSVSRIYIKYRFRLPVNGFSIHSKQANFTYQVAYILVFVFYGWFSSNLVWRDKTMDKE